MCTVLDFVQHDPSLYEKAAPRASRAYREYAVTATTSPMNPRAGQAW